ncbi:capsular polysaccharide biosynthesis protein [Pacificibacter maritimus]|uniref:Capsular polysaccharide biosynthesis protein n=2 Tax=Pacificibacter maritimus TaxID=762213 RepID=A0A3N4UBR8_9RHOB|nr:capsular polysaccharide biosynthesis protein [Pacificibacter maritimus]
MPSGYKSAVIHAYGSWFGALTQNKHDFFTKLATMLKSHDIKPHLVEGNSRTSKGLLAEDHLHIIVGGPAMYGVGILHAFPSYLWGFWYFDEIGTGWNSSLRFARYTKDDIDPEHAAFFFNGVTGYMLRENVSKLRQEPRMDAPLRPSTAVIFCQPNKTTQPRHNFLSTEQMIETAAKFDRDAVVYVKPHPQQTKVGRLRTLEVCEDYPNVKTSDASIHDLIESARVVITQNSTTGFEALMQRKPVITCAKSDYWHATLTPKSVADLEAAIEFGPETMRDFDFEGYFHWFLEKHCLEPTKDNFSDRAWQRIRDKLMLP